jgi:hypothetical protein
VPPLDGVRLRELHTNEFLLERFYHSPSPAHFPGECIPLKNNAAPFRGTAVPPSLRNLGGKFLYVTAIRFTITRAIQEAHMVRILKFWALLVLLSSVQLVHAQVRETIAIMRTRYNTFKTQANR